MYIHVRPCVCVYTNARPKNRKKQAFGQLHSPGLLALRDAAFRLAPQAVKGPFFDFFIRLSLARCVRVWFGRTPILC